MFGQHDAEFSNTDKSIAWYCLLILASFSWTSVVKITFSVLDEAWVAKSVSSPSVPSLSDQL